MQLSRSINSVHTLQTICYYDHNSFHCTIASYFRINTTTSRALVPIKNQCKVATCVQSTASHVHYVFSSNMHVPLCSGNTHIHNNYIIPDSCQSRQKHTSTVCKVIGKPEQSNLFFAYRRHRLCVIHQLAQLLVKHNMHRACANRPLYMHCTSCCIHNNRHVHVNYL